jgi:hypothetical protein
MIVKGVTLYGLSGKLVRDVAGRLPDGYHGDWDVLHECAAPLVPERAAREALLVAMRDDGMLEQDEEGLWAVSRAGLRLAMASARPVRRATARRTVEALVRNAAEINVGKYAYWIDFLVCFGSYLDEHKDPIGDVDVLWHYVGRWNPGLPASDPLSFASVRHAAHARRRAARIPLTAGGWDGTRWPTVEVFRALKRGAHGVSLHGVTDAELVLAGSHRLLYERSPGAFERWCKRMEEIP